MKVWSTSGLHGNFANGVPASVNTYLVAVTQAQDPAGSDVPCLYSPREKVERDVHPGSLEARTAS